MRFNFDDIRISRTSGGAWEAYYDYYRLTTMGSTEQAALDRMREALAAKLDEPIENVTVSRFAFRDFLDMSRTADEVHDAESLGNFLLKVVQDGSQEPQPDYWQWKVDHLLFEGIGSFVKKRPRRPLTADDPKNIFDPTTVEEAFRYVAQCVVLAIIDE